jgi:hypothetical protein
MEEDEVLVLLECRLDVTDEVLVLLERRLDCNVAEGALELVEDSLLELDCTDEDGRAEEVEREELAALQEPNALWHPVPQYSEAEPHQPHFEQQLPSSEFKQVYPLDPPQLPSGLSF